MKEYLSPWEEVLNRQNTSPEGLSGQEAAGRLEQYGRNKLEEGKNELRMLKSKTAHRLEFNDGEETPGLTLTTAKESRLVIDDKAQTITLSDPKTENSLKIDIGGGKIVLEAKTSLVLQCGGASIELNGSSNEITVKTSGNIKIDGQQVDIAGKTAVNAKASGQLNLEASGPANLKGAIVKVN